MTEPYLRVYAADMRADPKIARLDWADSYLLIQLWDLAKNGPGDARDVNGPDGDPMSGADIARLVGGTYQRVNAGIQRMSKLGVCSRSATGAVHFATLERRQGLDKTNALRQARFRAKRNGGVTPEVTEPVTAYAGADQNQNQSKEQTHVDLGDRRVWAVYVEHHPRATFTKARRQLIRRRLGEFAEETLIAAIRGNHRDAYCNGENPSGREYHDLELILRNGDKIERYAELATNGAVGHRPQPPPVADLPELPPVNPDTARRARELAESIGRRI